MNFGALFAFMLLHISVVLHYVWRNHSRNWLSHVVSPLLGFLVIGYVWLNMDINAKKGGFTWLVIGLIVLAVLKARGRNVAVHDVREGGPDESVDSRVERPGA